LAQGSGEGGRVLREGHPFVPYQTEPVTAEETIWRATAHRDASERRRSVREFDRRDVPRATIEQILLAASTSPSGAHRQPWTFVAVRNPAIKVKIREAAEEEERRNYSGRMPEDWLAALAPLGTDEVKTHLTDAPWIVVVFAQKHGLDDHGERVKHYYVRESVGMACGMLVAAAHAAGLAALTHTPSPMAFLGELLGRPSHEQAYVVVPIGFPSPDCLVPDIRRKDLAEVGVFFDVDRIEGD